MNNWNSFTSSNKPKKTQNAGNLIEALKELGNEAKQQASDIVVGAGKDAFGQIFGGSSTADKQTAEVNTSKNSSFEEYLSSRESQIAVQEKQKFDRRIEEERMVFHRSQEEAKMQIKAVQEELKKLADTTETLSAEVKKAVFNAAVDPGVYHEGFFDRIRKAIEFARKKIADSQTWLQVFNNRSKKRSVYWTQAKKSGTKFTLSQERYMAAMG